MTVREWFLRAADQNAGQEHQDAAEPYLQNRGYRRRIHITVPDPRNDAELYQHHHSGDNHSQPKTWDEEQQRVPDSSESRHESAHDAARPRMAAAGEAAIVGKSFRKAHADARA